MAEQKSTFQLFAEKNHTYNFLCDIGFHKWEKITQEYCSRTNCWQFGFGKGFLRRERPMPLVFYKIKMKVFVFFRIYRLKCFVLKHTLWKWRNYKYTKEKKLYEDSEDG